MVISKFDRMRLICLSNYIFWKTWIKIKICNECKKDSLSVEMALLQLVVVSIHSSYSFITFIYF